MRAVPIQEAPSKGRNSKATSNAPSVSQANEGYNRWNLRGLAYPRIHCAPVRTGLLLKENAEKSKKEKRKKEQGKKGQTVFSS